MQPHQRWEAQGQLEADSAPMDDKDVVAILERRAVQGFAGEARFHGVDRESSLLGAEVCNEVREAVVVHVVEVRESRKFKPRICYARYYGLCQTRRRWA